MNRSIRFLPGLVLGAVIGAAVTFGVLRWVDKSPHYAFLNDDLNQPVRTVVAEERMRHWAKHIHSGHLNEFLYRDKVVVYPMHAEPTLTPEGVIVQTSIGIRPHSTAVAMDEARAIWETASEKERTEAYDFVCSRLADYLSDALKMEKNRIRVSYTAR